MPSFLSGWNYRKAIKYGTVKPGSDLTAFPLLLKIVADTDIGAVLSSRKFAVTAADGTTQIPYGPYNDFAIGTNGTVSDNFNRASLGSNWTNPGGIGSISSNQLVIGGAGGKIVWAGYAFTNNDQFLQIKAVNASTAGGGSHQVVIRSPDGIDGIGLLLDGAGYLRLGHVNSGAFTTEVSFFDSPVADGDTIGVQVTGNTVYAFRNGVQKTPGYTETTFTSGGGVAIGGVAGTIIDDFTATGVNGCTCTLRAKCDPSSTASTGDVIGYLYYDPAQTDQANRAGVCDAVEEIFSPLEEDPSGSAPQMVNWAGTGDGTTAGSMTSGELVAGKVANCLSFDGNDEVNYHSIGHGTKITFQAWVKPVTAATGSEQSIMFFSNSWFGLTGGGILRFTIQAVDSLSEGGTRSDGVWINVAISKDESASYCEIYINGTSVNSSTSFSNDNGFNNAFGLASFQSLAHWAGLIDEVHLCSGANRSADWIAYTYQNELNNADTVTLGAQETAPASGEYPYAMIDRIRRMRRQREYLSRS